MAKIAPWPLDGENVGLPLSLVMNRKKNDDDDNPQASLFITWCENQEFQSLTV